MDLLNHQYSHIDIQSYRDNDQKYAAQLAGQAQAGGLNIFDLGYAVLGAMGKIAEKQAYFLCYDKRKDRLNHLEYLYMF